VRGEVFLELKNLEPPPPSAQFLTTARRVATIYAIHPPLHLMKDYVQVPRVSTSARGVISASKSSADMPWRIDAP
jgi:hypothetical protein